MVFDVLLPAGKKLVVGYGLGSMDGNGELLLTDIAQKVLERVARHAEPGTIRIVELKDQGRMRARIKSAFDAAEDESPIMFVAASDRIMAMLNTIIGLQRGGPADSD